jgi:hypothetical protein
MKIRKNLIVGSFFDFSDICLFVVRFSIIILNSLFRCLFFSLGSILQPLAIQWKDFELQQSSKLDRLLSLNKDSRFFLKVPSFFSSKL